MDPAAERRCHVLIGASLLLLTVGIGYMIAFGTTLADFLVIVTGLLLGWVAFIVCLSGASFWR